MPPVSEGILDGDRLVGGRCQACGRPHFPLAGTCPYCGHDVIARIVLSDRGTLWAWTAVTAPPPGYTGEVPYGFGVVELPEGLRIITRLTEADVDALKFGQPMKLSVVTLHDDVVTYAFGPAQ
jgi:uncharacterized OB-fold protein